MLALPFGCGARVLAAYAIVFSVWPSVETNTRLKIMFAGTVMFLALAWLLA